MSKLATKIISWQKEHGRHDLPWQNTTDPYAIWVSEIMLQQTQVAAVIGYYATFMQRFPTIAALAKSDQETVLQYWSGLGYYSRARNLHNAAQKIVDDFNGEFPTDFDEITHLPGIGRSTAAAISTFALDNPQPILDGNVKRVFARYFSIEGWTGTPTIQKELWLIAERENPNAKHSNHDAIAYTQGLMDLGATVCTRSKPTCTICPLQKTCKAYINHQTNTLPTPKPKKTIPRKETTMLVIRMGNEVLLQKRPQKGIWAGLWSLPEISMSEIATEAAQQQFSLHTESEEPLEIVNHAFTHYKLAITPQPLTVTSTSKQENATTIWMPIKDAIGAAIPTPVRNILLKLLNT
jgi:A/G-specific adenine glycosylase